MNLFPTDDYIILDVRLATMFGLEPALVIGAIRDYITTMKGEDDSVCRRVDGVWWVTISNEMWRFLAAMDDFAARQALKNLMRLRLVRHTTLKGEPEKDWFTVDENQFQEFVKMWTVAGSPQMMRDPQEHHNFILDWLDPQGEI